jgi:hypothetical protein
MRRGNDFWLNKCVHPDDRSLEEKYLKNNSFPEKREFRIVKPDYTIRKIRGKVSKKV